ncbi:uncharacterized protein LOC110990135 [Acanthaster planci]|uniref:Uncharacterized protein LOC110990135 n=1 Tax=Acanthaster planci TaxID=133434 RepID=A0A8B7ZYT1_ACAPL|nr:uncharacterized protein LOC110990135 [Acanthaster planci]
MQRLIGDRVVRLVVFVVVFCTLSAMSQSSDEDFESSYSSSSQYEGWPKRLPCIDNNRRISYHGETYSPCPCSSCTCQNSTLLCLMQSCHPPTCSKPVHPPDRCCQECPFNVTVTSVTPMLSGVLSSQAGREENFFTVNLKVTYANTNETTNIVGQGLWQTAMWLSSQEDGSVKLPGTLVDNVLTEGQQSQSLLKRGRTSTNFFIENIRYPVDMTDLTDGKAQYLCAKFSKGENPEFEKSYLEFHFEAKPTEDVLIGCTLLENRRDVSVNSVTLMLSGDGSIQEGREENFLIVNLTATYANTKTTNIARQGLWQTAMWLSSQEDGSVELPGTLADNVLTEDHQSQDLLERDAVSTSFFFSEIRYYVDMSDLKCDEAQYVCVKFNKRDKPELQRSFRRFHFAARGRPRENVLIGCTPLEGCRVPPAKLPCRDNTGQWYLHGETFSHTVCSSCTCDNSVLRCYFYSCLPLTCSKPISLPGKCCRVCQYDITVTSVTPMLSGDLSSQAGREENFLTVNLKVTYANTKETTSIVGRGLWQTAMWLSSHEDGSVKLPGTLMDNVLTEDQQSQSLMMRGNTSTNFVIANITYKVEKDLISGKARYLCATFSKGKNPELEKYVLFHLEARLSEDVLVGCTPLEDFRGNVRLVGGPNPWSGRVEIYLDDTWGTICDRDWDMDDVQVVCRQLGFTGAKEAKLGAYFGEGEGPVHMTGLACKGTENHLPECLSRCWERPTCTHKQDAGATCRDNSG